MSKSVNSPLGTILLLDEPAEIERKVKKAVTDTDGEVRYDPEAKPGLSNLLELLAVATDRSPAEVAASLHRGTATSRHDVAEALVELLRPVRERRAALAADPGGVAALLSKGADKARAIASATYRRAARGHRAPQPGLTVGRHRAHSCRAIAPPPGAAGASGGPTSSTAAQTSSAEPGQRRHGQPHRGRPGEVGEGDQVVAGARERHPLDDADCVHGDGRAGPGPGAGGRGQGLDGGPPAGGPRLAADQQRGRGGVHRDLLVPVLAGGRGGGRAPGRGRVHLPVPLTQAQPRARVLRKTAKEPMSAGEDPVGRGDPVLHAAVEGHLAGLGGDRRGGRPPSVPVPGRLDDEPGGPDPAG